MRLVLAIDAFRPSRGGAGRCVADLARGLVKAGHEPILLAGVAEDLPGIETVRIPLSGGRAGRVTSFVRGTEAWLATHEHDLSIGFGAQGPVDVYYPHGGSWPAWAAQEIASRESPFGRALQRIRLDGNRRQQAIREAEERVLADPKLEGVVALSRRVARDLAAVPGGRPFHIDGNAGDTREDGGVPCAVIPNGIDPPDPADLPSRDDARRSLGLDGRPWILFGADNFRLKGLANFLRAMARPELAEAGVLVVGGGRAGPYRRLASRLGLDDRLRWEGHAVSLLPYFAACDVLLQPTFYDPCSRTTIESLAAGCPVVTTSPNGAGELIGEGAGRVVDDPRDAAGLAVATAAFLGGARGRASEAARACVADRTSGRNLRDVVPFLERLRQRRDTASAGGAG